MVKRTALPLLLVALIICLLTGCSAAQQPLATNQPGASENRIVIVYLSRTNNTKAVAEMIREEVGGTLVPIELENPYPQNYQLTVQQVARDNETGYLPPLRTKIGDFGKYDVVFLGFPTWGMQLPPPMKSFLRQHDLNGKTIVPFNTNAGYGEGSSFRTVRELCSGCKVLEGFAIRGGVERDGRFLVIKAKERMKSRRK